MADTQPLGRHHQYLTDPPPPRSRRRGARLAIGVAVATVLVLAAGVTLVLRSDPGSSGPVSPALQNGRVALPVTPGYYVGVYPHGAPASYAAATAFAGETGITPRLVVYYSGWLEPFKTGFARTASRQGAVPLVQINPTGVSLAAIASGHFDSYLRTYARAVGAYGHPVVLSFGHEMNGDWYSWANMNTSPATFVAAWRHIVTVFRAQGTRNVTWLWTVNAIHSEPGVVSPGPWWPGSSYVTWVGIDGYYYDSGSTFSSLFGPTIATVRTWTRKPILIAETSVAPAANQATKIGDLFAGLHLYGLLGLVWFNNNTDHDWQLTSPAAISAFRRAAAAYHRPAS
ncbi:MAG TPA: glycosyl hydrolase [Streptosporangiaceae bacterium]|nr:glycosyl hydrolase [Streptosporangiaceae bacterium]